MLQLMKIVIFERTDNNGRAEQGLLKTPNSLENSLKDLILFRKSIQFSPVTAV